MDQPEHFILRQEEGSFPKGLKKSALLKAADRDRGAEGANGKCCSAWMLCYSFDLRLLQILLC